MSSNITDMSVGSPSKHLLKFSFPLLIGNIFQQFYNMVDSIVVGNFVGPNAIAAVGTCGSMNFFCFSLSSGLAIGIGIIIAQYFGAKDDKNVRKTIANSIYVLGFATIIISILGFCICPFVLKLLNCPENILPDAVIYMRTTCCGIIFVVLYNGVASILRALGDSKSPLYFLILSSIINLVLDLIFVIVFTQIIEIIKYYLYDLTLGFTLTSSVNDNKSINLFSSLFNLVVLRTFCIIAICLAILLVPFILSSLTASFCSLDSLKGI